jgi:hypothetical protein
VIHQFMPFASKFYVECQRSAAVSAAARSTTQTV